MGEKIVPVTAIFKDSDDGEWQVSGFCRIGHLGREGVDIVTGDGGHQIGAGFRNKGITVARDGDLENLQHYPGFTLAGLEVRGPGFDPENN